MDFSISAVLGAFAGEPLAWISVGILAVVILVNGATDAPNAIATCVTTRAMRLSSALGMAAVCDLLGAVTVAAANTAVAETVSRLADFGPDRGDALAGLCAGMLAVAVWSLAAWHFGIPTSESHGLLAGLSGGAVAVHGGFSGLNGAEWTRVLVGIPLSALLGFGTGWAVCRLLRQLCKNLDRKRSSPAFRRAQAACAAVMAFSHGAQDGQKFIGVLWLISALTAGADTNRSFYAPLWLMMTVALLMAAGTALGGERIIRTVGAKMAHPGPCEGVSADAASAAALLTATLLGLPVSTTQIKTAVVAGAGASRRIRDVNWRVAADMVWAWVLTLPGCGVIGYLSARLLMAVC